MSNKKILKEIIQTVVISQVNNILEERPKRNWIESNVILKSGRSVQFGSKPHIQDVQRVIDDLCRIRERQVTGSATRARIADAVSSLRKELRAAQKKYETNNPETVEEV
jgi:uncharacterized coiled-coil DUF342 family protein